LKKTFFLILFSWLSLQSYAQALTDTLICVTNQLNGDVVLNLSPPPNPCPGCVFVGYNVFYASSKAGPYAQFVPNPTITNPAAVSFTHIGANGNSNTYYYYLETVCNCGGVNVSAYTDTIDNKDPVAPNINHVTVNGNNSVINWTPSSSPETYAYIIYYVQGGNFIIDTVYGHTTTSYTDLNPAHNPNNASCAYTIAALDRCNTLGIFNLLPQHSIHLTSSQNRCAHSVQLNWNFYTNWPGGVSKYIIYTSVNASPFAAAQTLSNNNSNFVFNGVKDGDKVCYYVRAYENGGRNDSSTSNIRCEAINIVQPPITNQFQTCTDLGSSTVSLQWVPDVNADLMNFEIAHSSSTGNYDPIALMNVSNPISAVYNYLHTNQNLTAIHYYQITAIDSCQQRYLPTTANTIVLNGTTSVENWNHLTWNKFNLSNATVNYYDVYRSVGGAAFQYLGSTSDSTLEYYDNIKFLYKEDSSICYKVQAVYTVASAFISGNQISSSNEWCAEPYSAFYVPNAIFPKGNNKIFKPLITFPILSDYKLEIYNRWGAKIFFSDAYAVGWDGTEDGKDALPGAYSYIIAFTKTNGKQFIKQGNVSVVY